MHELGITQELVALACERSKGAAITRIVVEIGKLSTVLPDAMRFCFDLCAENTPAAGAQLEIVEIPGLGRCRKCSAEITMDAALVRCSCGSMDVEWLSGEQLTLKELEIA
ncbi:MAG TPA: hydrogenase maturation nickel metallochaperone HypA [Candidatus Synoicihabitans sp.]|nr:hydrogenase maturation nickel metallochaperone HypA [Candidatus Synoicihabitans sp.]